MFCLTCWFEVNLLRYLIGITILFTATSAIVSLMVAFNMIKDDQLFITISAYLNGDMLNAAYIITVVMGSLSAVSVLLGATILTKLYH